MKNQYEEKFSKNYRNIPQSFIREILNVASRGDMISFAGGLPNPEFFPNRELAQSAEAVLNGSGDRVLQYAGSQGLHPLREWIAQRYNRKYGLSIAPENIVITSGSQQTLDVVAKMFIEPGDGIVIEKPTYLGALQAMSGYLPRFLPVDLMNDGPDMDRIGHLCREHVVKFMYCIPNFQNPSGICYNSEKRQMITDLSSRYGLLLLEDDPYNEIRFEGDDLPPLYRYVPENVLWTGSFSKMVAPGLRMGWVVLPPGLVSPFIRAKQSTDLHSNNLSQYVLWHYLTHNNIDEHLECIRIAYKNQCRAMQEMIRMYLPGEVECTCPDEGMFIWLTLPEGLNAEELVYECIRKGVAFVPGRSFFTNGEGDLHIRMNFSNSLVESIEKGMKIMGTVMESVRREKVCFMNNS
ncbi:MAG TPA: PLP-dependent aminotransferase family protein [Prolixibacteraceae bacterium]|nr:PLP-dependent aminotransferase family protein [Prolixibacteraceae bacterium]